jgi:UDP-N-acetyl-D-glucosamine dehydrogenase
MMSACLQGCFDTPDDTEVEDDAHGRSFYLNWKAREFDVPTRFIELAGEINAAESRAVVHALAATLSERKRLSLNGARVLLLGLAYKKSVDDLRESPALVIMQDLLGRGAEVFYFDP